VLYVLPYIWYIAILPVPYTLLPAVPNSWDSAFSFGASQGTPFGREVPQVIEYHYAVLPLKGKCSVLGRKLQNRVLA
jgi:hypothetical protein